MARLIMVCFGRLKVSLDGHEVAAFESVKVRALLGILAGEAAISHSRDRLAGMLWPGWPQKSALNNLRYALADLRKNIGDRSADPSFLLVDHETLQLNPHGDWWADCEQLDRLTHPPQSLETLQQAVALFQGDFLDGINLNDSPEFEQWLLEKREYFRKQAAKMCLLLAEQGTQEGQFERALAAAQRAVELEPWLEEGHCLVIRILGLLGRRSEALAQFEKIKRILQEELEVSPSQQTLDLYEQIRSERLSQAKAVPQFILPDPHGTSPSTSTIARQSELTYLRARLDQAIAGSGGVVLVTGEAGRGKTTLIGEFIRQALRQYPQLLIAQGNCQAYFGQGDAYLPFREILAMLTGEVESRWQSHAILQEHARRLWDWIPKTARALVEHGQALIETLIPGQALLERARATVAGEPGWLARLSEIVTTRHREAGSIRSTQDSLYSQFKNTLYAIARQAPVLLVLDDMQWADEGSLGLLFSLGKHLAGIPLLILASYRDAEASQSFLRMVQEFKLVYGDIEVKTGGNDEVVFSRAYLESQPNLFSESFRGNFAKLTQGHPLYASELFRSLVEQGKIVKNEQGQWRESGAINWELLPVRVEAAIGERVNHFSSELQELLTVASVQGISFNTEVLSEVCQQSVEQVMKILIQQAQDKHQFIHSVKMERLAGRRITFFDFQHILVQKYLYQKIDDVMRKIYHEQTAIALERLYGEAIDQILPQLAHHYEQAGLSHQAIRILYLAGEKAARLYAFAESENFIKRALALLSGEANDWRFKLQWLLVKNHIQDGQLELGLQSIPALEELARRLSPRERGQAALCHGEISVYFLRFEEAEQVLRQAIAFSQQAGEMRMQAMAYLNLSLVNESLEDWNSALAIARQCEDQRLEATVLRECFQIPDYPPEEILPTLQRALEVSRLVGDRYLEGRILNPVSYQLRLQGRLDQAIAYQEESRKICQEVGNRFDELYAVRDLTCTLLAVGWRWDELPVLAQEVVSLSCTTGIPRMKHTAYACLSLMAGAQGDGKNSLAYSLQALEAIDKSETNYYFLLGFFQGDALLQMGRLEEAEQIYQAALLGFTENGMTEFAARIHICLAHVFFLKGELEQALGWVHSILPWNSADLGKNLFLTYIFFPKDALTCIHILMAGKDPLASALLTEAYTFLQDRAARIENKPMRQAYLENFPWNQEIIRLWQAVNHQDSCSG